MLIKTANFIGSFPSFKQCPPPNMPEFAFIGRSNVGKSSLINMLTKRNSLARVSNTPGKTQTINHYLINNNWYLVDLPGYGYAKTSKTQRAKYDLMIRNYIHKRPNLMCVFQLIDSRISPQKIDLEFINFMGEGQVPFIILFTKIDNKKYKPANIEIFKTALAETWNTLPQTMLTSAHKKQGREEILAFIEEVINGYPQ